MNFASNLLGLDSFGTIISSRSVTAMCVHVIVRAPATIAVLGYVHTLHK